MCGVLSGFGMILAVLPAAIRAFSLYFGMDICNCNIHALPRGGGDCMGHSATHVSCKKVTFGMALAIHVYSIYIVYLTYQSAPLGTQRIMYIYRGMKPLAIAIYGI
jgi:hypothetical protein